MLEPRLMEIDPYYIEDAEEKWHAWNERCLVSHHHHFIPARNDQVNFYQPEKPLSEMRVALVSSGGVYLEGSQPFDMQSTRGDVSVRWIPSQVPISKIRFEHDHYDHHDAEEDPNCMFPIGRLRELAEIGVVGGLAKVHVGFMGWIPNPDRFLEETIPEVIDRLKQDRVDAAVFSPG